MVGVKRRTAGAGSINRLPSGRWRVRVRDQGGVQKSGGTYATEQEARSTLSAVLIGLAGANAAPVGATTLRAWGASWLDRREVDGIRGIVQERSVWECHVVSHSIADLPLREITRRHVLAWLAAVRATHARVPKRGGGFAVTDRPVSRRVVLHALHLVRGALHAARDADLVREDATLGVKLPRAQGRVDDPWTYLTAEEVTAVTSCEAIPSREREIYTVAIFAGLRQGELWALRWDDVDLDRRELTVRRSHGGPTKSGKVRRVPILQQAVDALTSARSQTDGPLVFPGESGGRRCKGDDARWAPQTRAKGRTNGYRVRAGIVRRVRFHDLRHTCASHLLMGTWCPALSLPEVAQWLGHSSVTMTERYAHLAPERLSARVSASQGTVGTRATPVSAETLGFPARPRGVEPLTLGSEVRCSIH